MPNPSAATAKKITQVTMIVQITTTTVYPTALSGGDFISTGRPRKSRYRL